MVQEVLSDLLAQCKEAEGLSLSANQKSAQSTVVGTHDTGMHKTKYIILVLNEWLIDLYSLIQKKTFKGFRTWELIRPIPEKRAIQSGGHRDD